MQATDRREVLRPVEVERRSGDDRRRDDDRRSRRAHPTGRRRTDIVLPPLSRLIPALLVVAVSVVDLALAQATETHGWSWLVIVAAFPIAAYDLVNPWRWRWHLVAVWIAVVVYVIAAGGHIMSMLTG